MDKYRLNCETDGKVEVISSIEPTECPNNSEHTITAESISLTEENILVNDGTPKNLTIADYKTLRNNEIDYKTWELIKLGFSFDGQTFSNSVYYRGHWNTLKNSEAEFTWPKEISTIDSDRYSLSQANLSSFWNAAKDSLDAHLTTRRDLKKLIFDAVDEDAVDAIIDER